MKKFLFILLVMFSATVFSANNQRLEARPILFLDVNIKTQCLEAKDLILHGENRRKQFEKEYQDLCALSKRDFLSKFGKEMSLSRTAAFSNNAERETVQAFWSRVDKFNAVRQDVGDKEGEAWNKIDKRIAELAEEYAKEMGACAVTGTQLFYDPAYDITARMLGQLNKEYLERISSHSAKQTCACDCHKG